ncbi:hypothetical protein [Pseudoalteromonas aurantia]|uniref:Ricin B lectin domain-containing protein n=1 Tax=Pseudoalteromonas aurantia 208 TaxID=1314867 RepID=A0ABR9EBE4_9GAMM|nr:hypothetical protein [Pseudoalteromonas aurantia]MBE0368301.1 hypothetical protein [Pseudoalteromonas aurantia 208]
MNFTLNTLTASALAATSLVMSATAVASDNKITNIKVNGDTVHFSTSQAKSHTLPNCVTSANNQQWTLSLNSAAGKASYTLLVAAMTDNRSISVTSANDCADSTGYERAQSVEVGNASQQSGAGSSKLMTLYQGDGVTKVGTIYSITGIGNSTSFQLLRNEGDKWLDSVAPYYNMQPVWVYYTNTDCTGDVALDAVDTTKLSYNENFNNGHFFHVGNAPSQRYVKSYKQQTGSQCHSMSGQYKSVIVTNLNAIDRTCGVAPCQIRTQ